MTKAPNLNELGDRLDRLISYRGLSQNELARRAGVDQSHISRLKQGKRDPGSAILAALEQALDVRRGTLLGVWPMPDDPPPPSLVRFLASELAQSLNPPLSPAEVDDLRLSRWFPEDREPTIAGWYQFALARRATKPKEPER